MPKNFFAALFVAALFLSFSLAAIAQDAPKKAMEKKEKHELKSVSCAPECGFKIRSHDEKELISLVQMHAKNAHNMSMSEQDVKAKMKTEGMSHDDMKSVEKKVEKKVMEEKKMDKPMDEMK